MSARLTDEQLHQFPDDCHGREREAVLIRNNVATELIALRAERVKLVGAATNLLVSYKWLLKEADGRVRMNSYIADMETALAQPAESGATVCIACNKSVGDRQTYIPTAKGPMHPSCWEATGAKP